MEYDVVVVGGGWAGLSAGLVLSRARRRVVVVDAGEPRNGVSAHLHGVLTRDGAVPSELLTTGRDEVTGFGGEIVQGEVRGIGRSDGGYVVRLDGGRELTTRGVLAATGLRDELPDVLGVRALWGGDVLHCPYCHGYEVRDAPIGVLGGENRGFTLHQAALIKLWTSDVVFFPDRIELTEEERERLVAWGVKIVDGEVRELVVEDERLAGVRMADGELVPRTAVFVGPRFLPNDELLKDLGCETGDNGWVKTNPMGATNVPGVWAAGNVVAEGAQLANAIAAGSAAAIGMNHYLLALDVETAVRNSRGVQ